MIRNTEYNVAPSLSERAGGEVPRWRGFATRAISAGKYSPPWKLSGAEVSEGLGEANAQRNARITNPREQC